MYKKTYHATHPDSMEGATNDQLRDRYLVSDLFVAGEVVLLHNHLWHRSGRTSLGKPSLDVRATNL